MNQIKWMWNGLKVDGKLYSGSYSKDVLINDTEETITVYGNHYQSFPRIEGLTIQNDSDSMTDYFENDRIRIRQSSPFWKEALAAYEAAQVHHKKMHEKRMAKCVAYHAKQLVEAL